MALAATSSSTTMLYSWTAVSSGPFNGHHGRSLGQQGDSAGGSNRRDDPLHVVLEAPGVPGALRSEPQAARPLVVRVVMTVHQQEVVRGRVKLQQRVDRGCAIGGCGAGDAGVDDCHRIASCRPEAVGQNRHVPAKEVPPVGRVVVGRNVVAAADGDAVSHGHVPVANANRRRSVVRRMADDLVAAAIDEIRFDDMFCRGPVPQPRRRTGPEVGRHRHTVDHELHALSGRTETRIGDELERGGSLDVSRPRLSSSTDGAMHCRCSTLSSATTVYGSSFTSESRPQPHVSTVLGGNATSFSSSIGRKDADGDGAAPVDPVGADVELVLTDVADGHLRPGAAGSGIRPRPAGRRDRSGSRAAPAAAPPATGSPRRVRVAVEGIDGGVVSAGRLLAVDGSSGPSRSSRTLTTDDGHRARRSCRTPERVGHGEGHRERSGTIKVHHARIQRRQVGNSRASVRRSSDMSGADCYRDRWPSPRD